MVLEKQLRLKEVAALTGLAVATLRGKIARRELSSRKLGRIVTIPEREVRRFLATGHDIPPPA